MRTIKQAATTVATHALFLFVALAVAGAGAVMAGVDDEAEDKPAVGRYHLVQSAYDVPLDGEDFVMRRLLRIDTATGNIDWLNEERTSNVATKPNGDIISTTFTVNRQWQPFKECKDVSYTVR